MRVMNTRHVLRGVRAGLALAACALQAHGQQSDPHASYLYPAGGRQGTTFEARLGGQYLAGAGAPAVSGQGVRAEVVRHYTILTQQQLNRLRNNMERLTALEAALPEDPALQWQVDNLRAQVQSVLHAAGIEEFSPRAVQAYRRAMQDPKRQINPALSEYVHLRIIIDPDAPPGDREVRVPTSRGLTNPLRFQVGNVAEVMEVEPNDGFPGMAVETSLPLVLNGQILPGDVDRFRFTAQEGQRLVVSVAARELIPYLADAVPGWFQATLAVYDARGREMAYADDHFHDPDPVILFVVPETGEYVVEIKDAIFRGREDFVYRITVGEHPFPIGIFPLGGRAGDTVTLSLHGWNLPRDTIAVTLNGPPMPRLETVCLEEAIAIPWQALLAVDGWPEVTEREPNDDESDAMEVILPVILNGKIDAPGDRDLYRFEAAAGETLVAEVHARRLGSPLDSLLRLLDATGKVLASNDDFIDPGTGLLAHHADSRLEYTFLEAGRYLLEIRDVQGQGGMAFAYRCSLGPPRPDFALHIVPSSLNLRAGMATPVTVHALRRDGFEGEIALDWKGKPPPGFALGGARIPSGQDRIRMTISAPPSGLEHAVALRLVGEGQIEGRSVRRDVIPADDRMQAFFYRHLVPAQALMATVGGRARGVRPAARWLSAEPLRIAQGGSATVRIRLPGLPPGATLQVIGVDAPGGITVSARATDTPGRQGEAVVVVAVDGDMAEGAKGNLILEAVMVRPAQGAEGEPRPVSLGILPAMAFEVVLPQ